MLAGADAAANHYPYPRVFISNLLVEQLSPTAAAVVRKYTSTASSTTAAGVSAGVSTAAGGTSNRSHTATCT